MKKLLLTLTALLLTPLAALHAADTPAKPQSSPPEFTSVTDDPKLPRVLIIGDSVSVAYTLGVRKELVGVANVHRVASNGGSTKTALGVMASCAGCQM
jgi:acyl-CoA thioesterase-1